MRTLDEEGYDVVTGFNREGIHKKTQTRYDEEGYDYKGYDKKGFNKYGYNRDGDKIESGKKKIKHAEREKPTKENDSLFIYRGTNARGFRKNGSNVFQGNHDRRGFLFDGTNIDTGTQYNRYGYDAYGYNEEGYDEYGFNKDGIHEYTGTQYDIDGFDKDRYNERGFSEINKKHRVTNTVYDEKGFNIDGLWHGELVYSKETGYDVKGFNKEGINEYTGTKYDTEGYDRDGYNDKGYDKDGYDKLGIDNEGISRDTGEKDERVLFAEEFISFGKSIEKFAKEKGLSAKEVDASIERIRKSPCVRDRIASTLERNSDIFIGTMVGKKQKLLAGELAIKDIKGINTILKLADEDEKERISEMLIKSIASHDISILEYKKIFEIQKLGQDLPKNIVGKIKSVNYMVKNSENLDIRMLSKEMNKEIGRVEEYSEPYRPVEGEQMGYVEENTGELKMFTITDEYKNMAREYLMATDEFICDKTMKDTLKQIIRGQLDNDKVNRAKSEKELRELQKEDNELDEVIELAEKVIEKNKEKDKKANVNEQES